MTISVTCLKVRLMETYFSWQQIPVIDRPDWPPQLRTRPSPILISAVDVSNYPHKTYVIFDSLFKSVISVKRETNIPITIKLYYTCPFQIAIPQLLTRQINSEHWRACAHLLNAKYSLFDKWRVFSVVCCAKKAYSFTRGRTNVLSISRNKSYPSSPRKNWRFV